MTATEARKLNDEYAMKNQLDYHKIDMQIEAFAKLGKVQVLVDLLKGIDMSYRDRIFEYLKVEYEAKGFKVTRKKSNGGGTYDDMPEDWAYITW